MNLNDWLKQRRKLCDEATQGEWRDVTQTNDPNHRIDFGDGFGCWVDFECGLYADFIASHDPATMRLIYDVVEAAKSTYARQTDANARWAMQDIGEALKALQNKVGGDE